ncbi:MAG: dTDP-4-keto-6-deoxy-D-glucose epimerase, partial [Chitinophagaceae bacterium]
AEGAGIDPVCSKWDSRLIQSAPISKQATCGSRVMRGTAKVVDVAVDIRKNSPTYGQHFAIELSGENHKQLWVPPGFLHGFLTLEDNTIFTYKVTNYYDKDSEIGVMWNDPTLSIDWAAYLDPSEFLLSDKDLVLSDFNSLKSPF